VPISWSRYVIAMYTRNEVSLTEEMYMDGITMYLMYVKVVVEHADNFNYTCMSPFAII